LCAPARIVVYLCLPQRPSTAPVYARQLLPTMSLPSLPMFSRALSHAEKDPSKIAIVDVDGKTFTYGDLMRDVDAFRAKIREAVGGEE
jgi:hypothetical protein